MPVTDLSACIINLYFFYMRPDHRFNFVDELHSLRPPGTAHWLEQGFLDKSKRMPLVEAELRFANGYIAGAGLYGTEHGPDASDPGSRRMAFQRIREHVHARRNPF